MDWSIGLENLKKINSDLISIPAVFALQVAIVGVIRDAQESATNIMYTINDMTGEDIIVRKWLDNEVRFEVMSPLFIECTFKWKTPL